MRYINFDEVVKAVKNLVAYSASNLPADALKALKQALENEKSEVSKEVLRQILENAEIASTETRPLCQDTGLAVFL